MNVAKLESTMQCMLQIYRTHHLQTRTHSYTVKLMHQNEPIKLHPLKSICTFSILLQLHDAKFHCFWRTLFGTVCLFVRNDIGTEHMHKAFAFQMFTSLLSYIDTRSLKCRLIYTMMSHSCRMRYSIWWHKKKNWTELNRIGSDKIGLWSILMNKKRENNKL